MPKKGNGADLATDYLRQIVEKLGGMEKGLVAVREGLDGVQREQQAMRREQQAMRREQELMRREQEGMRLELVGVRGEIVGMKSEIVGMKEELKQHGVRLDHIEEAVRRIATVAGQEFQDLKRRVETLERKAA